MILDAVTPKEIEYYIILNEVDIASGGFLGYYFSLLIQRG